MAALKIVCAGDPVLRQVARPLAPDEIASPRIRDLITAMRDTMREAPGVGLAAPQIGESIQLLVIEDKKEYMAEVAREFLEESGREPVPFHVLVNPRLFLAGPARAEFFEGCLSIPGFRALVPRSLQVEVRALNEQGEPISVNASGWYARILQHEIDHLQGVLCVDPMLSRSLTTTDNFNRFWKGKSIAQVRKALNV